MLYRCMLNIYAYLERMFIDVCLSKYIYLLSYMSVMFVCVCVYIYVIIIAKPKNPLVAGFLPDVVSALDVCIH